MHWATHWDPPWSRWSTDAGVVVLKTRPNPITVRIESSHPLSFPGIARSSSCPQMVQWHAAQHLRHLRIEARARGSARGPGLRSRGPITRVCTVGGAAAAVGPTGARTPAATKPGNRGAACQRTALLGSIISGRLCGPTSPRAPLLYGWWGSSEANFPTSTSSL